MCVCKPQTIIIFIVDKYIYIKNHSLYETIIIFKFKIIIIFLLRIRAGLAQQMRIIFKLQSEATTAALRRGTMSANYCADLLTRNKS